MAFYKCPKCGFVFEGNPACCPKCGVKFNQPSSKSIAAAPVEEEKVVEPVVNPVEKEEEKPAMLVPESPSKPLPPADPNDDAPNSNFDGHLIQIIGWNILGFLVTVFTIGIMFPTALCWKWGWDINHTIVEGKRLHFDGHGVQLIGHWVLWVLLSIVTLTIFAWFIPIRLKKWKAKHTHIVAA